MFDFLEVRGPKTILKPSSHDFSELSPVFAVIMYNFVTPLVIPSWIFQKRPSTSIKRVIGASTICTAFLLILVGFTGALSFPDSDVLFLHSLEDKCDECSATTKGSVYILPLTTLFMSLPIFTIIARNNFMNYKPFRNSKFWEKMRVCNLFFNFGCYL